MRIGDIVDELRRGNNARLDRVIPSQFFEETYERRARQAIQKTFNAAGRAARQILEGQGIEAAFDVSNARAVEFNRRAGAALVTEVSEQTKEGIRGIIDRGFIEGRTRKQIAEDIREYGVGLTSRQSRAVMQPTAHPQCRCAMRLVFPNRRR